MAGHVTITPAETPAERTAFIHFQWEVYKNDPYWVPPLLSEREEFLDPDRHPFHRHAEVRYFLARRDGQIVGRIASIVNHRHNAFWDDKVGFFGLYEVLEDPEASSALLHAAEDAVRSAGMDTLRGPMSFSTNEECGLLVDGWNGPPVILMTYNPSYYPAYLEDAGYSKAHDLYAYLADLSHVEPDGTGFNPKVLRIARKVRDRLNVNIRPIDMKHFDADAAWFKRVYNAAWAKNWGFVPLTDAELQHEVHALKPIVDPRLVLFADRDGEPIAAGLPLPDLNQALHRAYPRPGVPEWWTLIKMWYWWKVRKSVTTLRAFAGGVIEPYRGRGIDAVMAMETLIRSIQSGYQQVEFSWVLESNIPMQQTARNLGGEIYRTYRIYEKSL
jgi:hypothetical protein